MKTTTTNPLDRNLARIEREVCRLLKSLKVDIADDCRATDDPDDNTPGMCVTVSTNDDASHWNYQTGDNSFSGSCYGDPHWAVIYLYRRSNCRELAKDAVNELGDLIATTRDFSANHVCGLIPNV